MSCRSSYGPSGNTLQRRVADRFPTGSSELAWRRDRRSERPVRHRRPVARRLPVGSAGHPVVRTPEPRPPRGGRRVVPAPLRAGRAVRAEPGVALHRHVPDEPPVGAQRHPARRPPHERRAGRRARLGYEPALFGYTDTSVDPRTVAPDDPRLRTYEGVLPGFDPVGYLPEGNPGRWLDWMRAAGVRRARRLARVRRPPGRGHRWRTQYDAKHSQTVFLTDRVLDFVDDRSAAAKPWFAHVSYLRPHPPFLAPAPYDTMFDPASVPAPVRARDPRRGRRAASAARRDDRPPVRRVARRPAGAARAAGDLLRDAGRGRRPARPPLRRARRDRRRPTTRSWCSRRITARRSATTGSCTSSAGSTRRSTCRSSCATRAPVRRDARPVVDAFTEHVDVLPDDLRAARHRGAVAVRRPAAHAVARRRDARRLAQRGALGVRLPRSRRRACSKAVFGLTLEECSLAVLRDDHGKYVHFSGHPTMPPIFFDLDTDPAQVVNRAADPAYAPTVLDYAQRMLAWRMHPRRAHAHRHEAHPARRAWSSAAPAAPLTGLQPFSELASETPDIRSFPSPVRTAGSRAGLIVHPRRPIRGRPDTYLGRCRETRRWARTSGITHAHRTGRTPGGVIALFVVGALPAVAWRLRHQGAPDANFGGRTGPCTERMARVDRRWRFDVAAGPGRQDRDVRCRAGTPASRST